MSDMAMTENSIALLDAALDAAGGLERWREHSFLSAHLSQAGDLSAMKGQGGVLDEVKIDVVLHREWVLTAMWTYLTQPFCLTLPRFRVEELSPWREDRNIRRLRVEWPEHLASHSTNQTLYFDEEDRLARHDYEVEIVAGAPAAHLFDGFASVDGITMPTRHRSMGGTQPVASTPAASSSRSTSTTSRSANSDLKRWRGACTWPTSARTRSDGSKDDGR
jgi:hypothetical protein